MFKVELVSIRYTKQNIGNDLVFVSDIKGQRKTFKPTLSFGSEFKPFAGQNILYSSSLVPAGVGAKVDFLFKVTEQDIFRDDIGSKQWQFTIPKYSIKDKLYNCSVSVSESSKRAEFVFQFKITCIHSLFSRLWNNHPATKGIINPCSTDNGVPNFDNQCAIRMSVALADSGINLDSFTGEFCWHKHGKRHVLRAQELADWIASKSLLFGNIDKKVSVTDKYFKGKLGVVFFRNFWGTGNQGDHIDLWYGDHMARGASDYFIKSEEVWFWQL